MTELYLDGYGIALEAGRRNILEIPASIPVSNNCLREGFVICATIGLAPATSR